LAFSRGDYYVVEVVEAAGVVETVGLQEFALAEVVMMIVAFVGQIS